MDYIPFHPGYMQQCAEWLYGPTAKAMNTTGHAYGWYAKLPNGKECPLDLQGYADAMFGGVNKNWRVILTNLGADGWWFHNPYNNDYIMQPVMIVPHELGNIPLINRATGRYESNWRYVRKWLKQANDGRTFTQANRTQLVMVPYTAEQLRQMARDTAQDGKRFDLLWWARKELLNRYKRINPNIIYACALYTGENDQAEDYGSGSDMGNTLVLSSDNTAIQINDPPMIANHKRAAYDMAHEYLHCLGLHHTDESQGADWKHSIMIWGEPDEAILTDYEKNKLRPSPHLKGA